MGKIDKYKMSKRKHNIKKISGGKAKKKAYSSTKGSHNLNVCQKSKTKQNKNLLPFFSSRQHPQISCCSFFLFFWITKHDSIQDHLIQIIMTFKKHEQAKILF